MTLNAYVYIRRISNLLISPAATVWGSKLPFNTICGEYTSPAGGWVHSVGFSPSGDVLAFASEWEWHLLAPLGHDPLLLGHDCSINIVYPTGPVFTIRTSSLPFATLIWTSENALVAAGHDCQPVVFAGSEAGWQGVGSLDDTSGARSLDGPRAGYGGSSSVGRLKTGAFATFRAADSHGQSNAPGSGPSGAGTKLLTVHQNTITNVRAYEERGGQVTKVSTSGVDGSLVVWDVNSVGSGGWK